jgi:hypothetical protein
MYDGKEVRDKGRQSSVKEERREMRDDSLVRGKRTRNEGRQPRRHVSTIQYLLCSMQYLCDSRSPRTRNVERQPSA